MTTPYEYAKLTAIWTRDTNSSAYTVQTASGVQALPGGDDEDIEALNFLGAEGWELLYHTAGPVGTSSFGTYNMMKRPLRR